MPQSSHSNPPFIPTTSTPTSTTSTSIHCLSGLGVAGKEVDDGGVVQQAVSLRGHGHAELGSQGLQQLPSLGRVEAEVGAEGLALQQRAKVTGGCRKENIEKNKRGG